jgi:membrane protein
MATVAAGESRTEREGMLACLVNDARAISPRAAWHAILRGFHDNDLLTYASAISFQVVFALLPLALLALGLLGSFGLSDVWSNDVAPTVKNNVSAPAFELIDRTVRQILHHRQLFWATLGAAIAVWEVSGAMRATMQVLNRVYGVPEKRSFRRKLAESILLSTVATVLLLLAAAVTKVGPLVAKALFGEGAVVSVLSFLASWGAAVALLFLVVTMVVRYAPDTRRPVRWVSFGGVLVIVGWIAMSLVYGWYITSLADYESIFGSLAVVMVTMSYIYLSAIVFLTGAQLDSLIRDQVDVRETIEAVPEEEQQTPKLFVARSAHGPAVPHEVEPR